MHGSGIRWGARSQYPQRGAPTGRFPLRGLLMPLNVAIQRIQRLMGSTAFLTDGAGGSAQTSSSNQVRLGPVTSSTAYSCPGTTYELLTPAGRVVGGSQPGLSSLSSPLSDV